MYDKVQVDAEKRKKFPALYSATIGITTPEYKNVFVCNCEHGWHNCTCDGNGGTRVGIGTAMSRGYNKLVCVACNESFIYSRGFEVYRCDECYDKEMERKENESTVDRDM
jgi:hypothetical protein